MRLQKIIPIAALLGFALLGCEKMDNSYQGDAFVAFGQDDVRVFKNGSSIKIPIMVSDDRTEEVTVTFELNPRQTEDGEDVVEGIDFTLENESTSLTFAPGEGIKYIVITPIDDYTFTGDKIIDIEIPSNSKNYKQGVPGPDSKYSKCVLTIRESNCLFVPTDWEGRITGWEEATTGGWWTDADSPGVWEFVEETSEKVYVFNVTGFFYAQAVSSDWAWYEQGDVEFLPVRVTIDLSNPAQPTYSLAPDQALVDGDDWGVFVKEVDAEPLTIDVCGKYLELPYTVTGTGWAHNHLFTIKYQF